MWWASGCAATILENAMKPKLTYKQIAPIDRAAVNEALLEDDPDRLSEIVVAVAMFERDWLYIQDLCVRLSSHPHPNVRGNAILGFGHAARRFRCLDQQIVQPIIQSGLEDENTFVRGQANAAKDDTEFFLKWLGYEVRREN
jgi:hypothetical protein